MSPKDSAQDLLESVTASRNRFQPAVSTINFNYRSLLNLSHLPYVAVLIQVALRIASLIVIMTAYRKDVESNFWVWVLICIEILIYVYFSRKLACTIKIWTVQDSEGSTSYFIDEKSKTHIITPFEYFFWIVQIVFFVWAFVLSICYLFTGSFIWVNLMLLSLCRLYSYRSTGESTFHTISRKTLWFHPH